MSKQLEEVKKYMNTLYGLTSYKPVENVSEIKTVIDYADSVRKELEFFKFKLFDINTKKELFKKQLEILMIQKEISYSDYEKILATFKYIFKED